MEKEENILKRNCAFSMFLLNHSYGSHHSASTKQRKTLSQVQKNNEMAKTLV